MHKDRLSIKKDLTEASEELVSSKNFKLQNKFKCKEYIPILSFNWNERYADLPIPTPDDIVRLYQISTAPKCNNLYNIEELNLDWGKKSPVAVFRGSYTGSSAKLKTNPRLHVAWLNREWSRTEEKKEYLNATISSFKGKLNRGRKEINDKYVRFLDKNYVQYLKGERLTHEQQSYFKYILYIEGNVSAYRGGFLFANKSVILWVKSHKFHLWFEPYLEEKVNCIFVERDLSDLYEKITWLKENDEQARQIAEEGYNLYQRLLNKEAIMEYYQYLLNSL